MSRYEKGLEKLREIDGKSGEEVIDSLMDFCPDLGRMIIEFGFNDIYRRPGLSNKEREMITIGALTVLGTLPQLKVHIRAGLHVGLSEEQIKEVILQMAAYAGFPAALNGMFTAKEVFESGKKDDIS